MRIRPALVAASLLAALSFAVVAAAVLPSSAAQAQEDDEPAPEPSIKFTDRGKKVAIDLPKNWKAEKFTEENGQIAYWIWPLEDGNAIAGMTILESPAHMRAELARYGYVLGRDVVDDTLERGEGWCQQAVEDRKNGLILYQRFIEKDGIVWLARFVCHKNNWERFRAVGEAALATFTVTGEFDQPKLPDGWQEEKVKDFILWTDADDENVKEAAKIVETQLDVRKVASKMLDGKPFDESPPRAMVVQNGSEFDDIARRGTGQVPDNAIYDSKGRALLIKWMARKTQGFDQQLVQWGAAQYVNQYFGGDVPLWLSGGLRMYAVYGTEDGGKPQKPDKDRMARVRGTVASTTRKLDAWFTTVSSDVPDMNVGFMELYAWHWFFRHAKQGKKYRKTYEACVSTLRETGDPDAAHAVWEGTDYSELFDDFKKWGSSL